jgi:hypothetical protein
MSALYVQKERKFKHKDEDFDNDDGLDLFAAPLNKKKQKTTTSKPKSVNINSFHDIPNIGELSEEEYIEERPKPRVKDYLAPGDVDTIILNSDSRDDGDEIEKFGKTILIKAASIQNKMAAASKPIESAIATTDDDVRMMMVMPLVPTASQRENAAKSSSTRDLATLNKQLESAKRSSASSFPSKVTNDLPKQSAVVVKLKIRLNGKHEWIAEVDKNAYFSKVSTFCYLAVSYRLMRHCC